MKLIFRKAIIMVLVFALLFAFSACSEKQGQDQTSVVSEGEQNTTASSSETGDEEQITLSFATSVYVEAPHRKVIDALIEAYNAKNPNVKIEVYGAGWDNFWDNLTTEILANSEGDIIQVYPENISRYHSLRDGGTFIDLKPYMEGKGFEEKLVGQEFCDVDGQTLALSNYAWGTTGIFYRKSMLEEEGINPEDIKTQEDFREAALKFVKDGKKAMAVVLGTHSFVVSEWCRLIARPVSNGLYFKDGESGPYTADRVNVNSLENVWAAQWWQDFIVKDQAVKLVPDKKDSRELFWNGNVPFNMDGPWFIGMTRERDPELMEDVGLIPQFDIEYNGKLYKPNPTLYPLVCMISKNCEHPEAAWDFLEWMTTTEAQDIIKECGMIPSNIDYSTSNEYIENYTLEHKFVEFMENNYTDLVSDPPIPQQGEIQQVMIDAAQAMFSEQAANVKEEMDKAQKLIEEIMSK